MIVIAVDNSMWPYNSSKHTFYDQNLVSLSRSWPDLFLRKEEKLCLREEKLCLREENMNCKRPSSSCFSGTRPSCLFARLLAYTVGGAEAIVLWFN